MTQLPNELLQAFERAYKQINSPESIKELQRQFPDKYQEIIKEVNYLNAKTAINQYLQTHPIFSKQ